jgi:hypothetical protein
VTWDTVGGMAKSQPQAHCHPVRILIDWDWGASGIWLISYHNVCSIPRNQAATTYALSAGLLDELKRWNDQGGRLARLPPWEVTDDSWSSFWSDGARLAQRVHDALGPDREVLYNHGDSEWSWTWVARPQRWG